MLVKPKFPEHRLHDPKRQAELAIYRELEVSTTPGAALYEPRFGPYTRGLDYRRLAPRTSAGMPSRTRAGITS